MVFRLVSCTNVVNSGFWDDNPPPEPSSLHGAGTTVESLRTSLRYEIASDNALELIAKDLSVEDGVLETCIRGGRLEQWWKGIIDAARTSARSEADRMGDEKSRQREAEQEFRDQMRRDDETAWGVNQSDDGRMGLDEEGDVVMEM